MIKMNDEQKMHHYMGIEMNREHNALFLISMLF